MMVVGKCRFLKCVTAVKRDPVQILLYNFQRLISPNSSQKSDFFSLVLSETVPGPGAYNPRYKQSYKHNPSFSIQGIRRETSHIYGPFAAF